MYIECQNCSHRQGNKCDIDGEYAEPNHIYASDSHCQKDKQLDGMCDLFRKEKCDWKK